jgi:hypothetical protein
VRWIFALAFLAVATPAQAEEDVWPNLKRGEIRVIEDFQKVSVLVRGAAGFSDSAPQHKTNFTFFKAPHGHDFLIVDPCCGENGKNASLFEFANAEVKNFELVMGDPRVGFKVQAQADAINVDAGAVSLRARIAFPNCEDGMWTYYYRFDENDKPTLLSVIDTSCAHLGVREFYHAKNVDVGHWWMK